MNKTIFCAIVVLNSTVGVLSASAENPYLGHWALTLPSGGPGWLGVTEEEGNLNAGILWGGGSVKPDLGHS